MNPEQLKEKSRNVFKSLEQGNVDELDNLLSDDATYRATSGEEARGREECKKFVSTYVDGFDNLEFDIQNIYVEQNQAVTIYRQKGRHTGELLGIEPSNNEMDILICNISTFDDDGMLVDTYEIYDTMELIQQLGASPADVGPRPGA